eukprot:3526679-Pyramimonas_sp.AAC.1
MLQSDAYAFAWGQYAELFKDGPRINVTTQSFPEWRRGPARYDGSFDVDVRIGTLPGIEKSGVRIHAWYVDRASKKAGYIMDHVSMGDPRVSKSMTVQEYFQDAEEAG